MSRLSSMHALTLLFVAGCAGSSQYAMIAGQKVPRPTLGYSNDGSFQIEHKSAFPGVFDPGRGADIEDGRILGRACGVDISFDASWYGSRLMLTGQGDVPWQKSFTHTEGAFQLSLNVTESEPGHRRIVGEVHGLGGSFLSSPIVDLDVSADRLVGRVGLRTFTLAADGDFLAGKYQRHGDVLRAIDEPYAIYGRQLLRTIVPADEALILVMMLTCNGLTVDYGGSNVRGFTLAPVPRG